MALTKVIGSGVGTLASNVAVTSDDPTITMTDSSGTNDIVTLQSTSGALIVTARDGSSNGEIIFKADTGSAVTEHMRINNIGAVTKPLQPAFLARTGSTISNFGVATATTVAYGTEIFDQNADYNNSNYTFTAPVTGRYQLNVLLILHNIDSASSYYQTQLITSNREYYHLVGPSSVDQDAIYQNFNVNSLADMDANDTAIVKIYQASGTLQSDIDGTSSFSGHLVC